MHSGAVLIELGVPSSDPMADGPMLQRPAGRALAGGTTLHRILETVVELRREITTPIVLFGYYNPFFRYGVEAIARAAAAAGVDGLLCVDLPPAAAGALRTAAEGNGLDLIAAGADHAAGAFVGRGGGQRIPYLVSVLGDGGRTRLPAELPDRSRRS